MLLLYKRISEITVKIVNTDTEELKNRILCLVN